MWIKQNSLMQFNDKAAKFAALFMHIFKKRMNIPLNEGLC